MHMNIGSLLTRHARYQPDKLALVFEDNRLTYREYNQNINRLANTLLVPLTALLAWLLAMARHNNVLLALTP